jgi:hypothetical protein
MGRKVQFWERIWPTTMRRSSRQSTSLSLSLSLFPPPLSVLSLSLSLSLCVLSLSATILKFCPLKKCFSTQKKRTTDQGTLAEGEGSVQLTSTLRQLVFVTKVNIVFKIKISLSRLVRRGGQL